MAISQKLGREMPPVDTPHGPIPWRERGEGPAVLFVHGFLCNGDLWRNVVPTLADRCRCVVPDWPLGSHVTPIPAGADVSPPGLARSIRVFIEALDLDAVTLVANDVGGALCQILLAEDRSRAERLLLTSCDSFGQLPPRYLKPLALAARAGLGRPLAAAARLRAVQRLTWASVAHARPADEVMESYLHGLDEPAIVADALRIARAARPRYTHAAARRLHRFTGPAIVAWGADDLWFWRRNGRRLAARLPRGRFTIVEGARTFVPEDAPGRVAELVEELLEAA